MKYYWITTNIQYHHHCPFPT